jgi:hypothetical protein
MSCCHLNLASGSLLLWDCRHRAPVIGNPIWENSQAHFLGASCLRPIDSFSRKPEASLNDFLSFSGAIGGRLLFRPNPLLSESSGQCKGPNDFVSSIIGVSMPEDACFLPSTSILYCRHRHVKAFHSCIFCAGFLHV